MEFRQLEYVVAVAEERHCGPRAPVLAAKTEQARFIRLADAVPTWETVTVPRRWPEPGMHRHPSTAFSGDFRPLPNAKCRAEAVASCKRPAPEP
jgi:hypothetical protein